MKTLLFALLCSVSITHGMERNTSPSKSIEQVQLLRVIKLAREKTLSLPNKPSRAKQLETQLNTLEAITLLVNCNGDGDLIRARRDLKDYQKQLRIQASKHAQNNAKKDVQERSKSVPLEEPIPSTTALRRSRSVPIDETFHPKLEALAEEDANEQDAPISFDRLKINLGTLFNEEA